MGEEKLKVQGWGLRVRSLECGKLEIGKEIIRGCFS
jgi:hypothetical protein